MFYEFHNWLKENGYSEVTPKGLPSTCTNYPMRIEYIMWYEHLSSWQDVVNNIDVLLPAYSEGGIRESIGHKSHDSVINALRRFCEFLIEKNIKPQKRLKKLVLEKKYDSAEEDVEEIPLYIYTIKYLDDGEVIKVTADKEKANENVLYLDIYKTPLMQNLLRKNKGDIVSFKIDNSNCEVEILNIEI